MSGGVTVTDRQARQILMLRAFETAGDSPLWTPEDRAWASRLARETAAGERPETLIAERARHAMERLAPRNAVVRRWLDWRPARRGWLLAVLAGLLAGLSLGLVADSLGGRYIDILAAPVWAVIAWNLLVYALLAAHALRAGSASAPGPLRRLMQKLWFPGGARKNSALAGYVTAWSALGAPLMAARTALVMHLAAAGLGLGMIGGMYLRGLVLDYRAGWQSTFLDAPAVHALLDVLLAPASRLTGIALPDTTAVAALRIGPDGIATAGAAPWIHWYAATLVLAVVLPRLLLALITTGQSVLRARHWALPWHEPYFQKLARELAGGRARVQVVPHGNRPLAAQVALDLQAAIQAALGEGSAVQVTAPVAYGDEESAAPLAAEAGITARLVCFDSAATPEPETHGRLLDLLVKAGMPVVALTDESAFAARFAAFPERLDERRAAWRGLAAAHGATHVTAKLDATISGPDRAALASRLREAPSETPKPQGTVPG
jgi:hypothetical protein